MDIIKIFSDFYRKEKKITVLTAYDVFTSTLCVQSGVVAVLVGDSLGNVIQGLPSTSGVSMEDMIYHTKIVHRICADRLPVIADLPADSYNDAQTALSNSKKLIDAGADAVKFEGAFPDIIGLLTKNGIPFMGHIGLLPQTALAFKVQGKNEEEAAAIIKDAKTIANAGAFSLVAECVPMSLGKKITESVCIPVIGIGAGSGTSGQVLVIHDLLGMSTGRKARFIKTGVSLLEMGLSIVSQYVREVGAGEYPDDEHSYH